MPTKSWREFKSIASLGFQAVDLTCCLVSFPALDIETMLQWWREQMSGKHGHAKCEWRFHEYVLRDDSMVMQRRGVMTDTHYRSEVIEWDSGSECIENGWLNGFLPRGYAAKATYPNGNAVLLSKVTLAASEMVEAAIKAIGWGPNGHQDFEPGQPLNLSVAEQREIRMPGVEEKATVRGWPRR